MLLEAIVAEFDAIVVDIVGQVEYEVLKGVARVEHDLAHIELVQLEQELIGEAECRIEMPVGRYAPQVDDSLVLGALL